MKEHRAPLTRTSEQRRLTRLLGFVVFFSVLNSTTFNVAVPDIAAQFGLLPSGVSWVMTSYIIVFAVGTVTYGKLADLYPVRTLITVALVLMSAGSLLGFLARWYPLVVAGRVFQASGGAAVPTLSMLVATHYFPPGLRGRVLGVLASTVALASGAGPILGGYVTGMFHWRYLFLLCTVTLITIPFFRRILPHEEKEGRRFDLPGAALLWAGVSALLVFVTEGVWALLPASFLCLLLFGLHIRRGEGKFLTPAVFRNRRYLGAVLTAFLAMGTVFAFIFVTPIMLRALNGLRAEDIGLTMFPGALSAALLGTAGGKLADRVGSVPVVYMGLLLLVLGFLLLSSLAGLPASRVALALVVSYVGFAFTQSSVAHAVAETLSGLSGESRGKAVPSGIGMGVFNMFFFTSGALSAALLGRLLDLGTTGFSLNPLTPPEGALYGNLYLFLAFSVALAAGLFHFTFRQR
ncbi:MAG: MFS transporter [Nitrospirota bacterium]|jgi:DHA2 family metal-tetracycline-proton antiporter-like MFS transporter